MVSELDPGWMHYRCKSGELLFYYNKDTAEHKFPKWDSTLGVRYIIYIYSNMFKILLLLLGGLSVARRFEKCALFFLWPQIANWVPRRMRSVPLRKLKAHC